jgi:hypothetical protein
VELAAAACQNGGVSAEDNPTPQTIATLRIDLLHSDPPIWREIEVPVAMTLKQLHAVIQAAMAWEDAHLWEFTLGRERIGSSRAARLTLQDLLRPRTTKLGYTYDMGDCWEHQLTLTMPRRRRIAAASPAFTPNSKPSPIRTTPITKTQRNGSATSIPTASTNSPSKTASPASQTDAEKPKPKPNRGDQLTLTSDRPQGGDHGRCRGDVRQPTS